MSVTYTVDYNDKRFADVKAEEQAKLTEAEQLYGGLISESKNFYENAANQYKIDANDGVTTAIEEQIDAQNKQTDFAIQKIEQQKAQAEKDYIKEQSASYGDYIRQSDAFGVEAEQKAAQGLAHTGYNESSKVKMFTAYQNRVATARESFERAKLNFDNGIQEAKLQNNSLIAELKANALKEQLEISLKGLINNQELVLGLTKEKTDIRNTYYNRYLAVLDQINEENKLAEQVRQAELDEKYRRDALKLEQDKFDYEKNPLAGLISAAVNGGADLSQKKKKSSGGTNSKSTSWQNSKASIKKTIEKVSKGSSKNQKLTVDKDSLAKLGLGGAVDPSYIDKLIKQGKIVEYEKNGKLYYQWKNGNPFLNPETMPNAARNKLGLR